MTSKEFTDLKFQILEHFWGYTSFREPQEEVINAVLSGKDVLTLLPTGAGKSLCYQLPALVLEGTCVVVSPLLALMKDQVQQLKQRGIEAEYLSSELDEAEAEAIYSRCKEGLTKLLYISPERLTNQLFLQQIEEITVSFLAVDEAHCISEWGQDFRPAYQNIKKFRELYKALPCLALTATATPEVLKEISEKLALKNPFVFQKSFQRANIQIVVEEISDKYQRISEILTFAKSSGIIYTQTRRQAEELHGFLAKTGHKNTAYYHAGLPTKLKNERQKWWIESQENVLIATNAFGMGIDKDNVRFVIHIAPSASIENYYQEIGRSGRDGLPSRAYLFWDRQELMNFDDILKNAYPSQQEFYKIVSALYSTFQIADNDLTEQTYQLNIDKIKNITKASAAKIRNILNFLHNQEVVYFNNSKSLSALELKISAQNLDLLPKKDGYFLEILLRNLQGLTSQKVLFSEANLSKKLNADPALIKERIRELQAKNYVDYIDGAQGSIRFLKHRDDRSIQGKYWALFSQIQRNKLQKWEEMKFYTQDKIHCKMRLILSYFGEKNTQNCGQCSVCNNKTEIFKATVADEIFGELSRGPATMEKISATISYQPREKILENLILLLDAGRIKMLDFRTYTVA